MRRVHTEIIGDDVGVAIEAKNGPGRATGVQSIDEIYPLIALPDLKQIRLVPPHTARVDAGNVLRSQSTHDLETDSAVTVVAVPDPDDEDVTHGPPIRPEETIRASGDPCLMFSSPSHSKCPDNACDAEGKWRATVTGVESSRGAWPQGDRRDLLRPP